MVLPALNLSSLEAGILIMVQQVRLMLFSLNMVASMILLLWVLNWVGLGWGWALGVLGLKVWGQGLTIFCDNILCKGERNGTCQTKEGNSSARP